MNALNRERAERGAIAVDQYEEFPECVQDCLTDLMHYCRHKKVNFADALRMASDHFACEVAEESETVSA